MNNMTDTQLKQKFQKISDSFNEAVVSNNVDEIKKCITEDWILVDTPAGIIPQERFFKVLEEGLLSHSEMTKEILRVKVYGDIAIVTGRGDRKSTRLNSSHVASSYAVFRLK